MIKHPGYTYGYTELSRSASVNPDLQMLSVMNLVGPSLLDEAFGPIRPCFIISLARYFTFELFHARRVNEISVSLYSTLLHNIKIGSRFARTTYV